MASGSYRIINRDDSAGLGWGFTTPTDIEGGLNARVKTTLRFSCRYSKRAFRSRSYAQPIATISGGTCNGQQTIGHLKRTIRRLGAFCHPARLKTVSKISPYRLFVEAAWPRVDDKSERLGWFGGARCS